MNVPRSHFRVVIIGGGFSGTALAIQLLRQMIGDLSIAVINRAGLPGRGVAYGTKCEEHLLNVNAGNMSVIPDEHAHFLHWLRSKVSKAVRPEDFVVRQLYGEYMEDTLSHALMRRPSVIFSWFHEDAISISLEGNKPSVTLSGGFALRSEVVILATGNSPPSDPPEVRAIKRRYYSPNAWAHDALDGIPNSGSVLLLGSGLTAVDQILALRTRKFCGRVVVLSRRGLLPSAHSAPALWPSDWSDMVPNTVCAMLKAVREQIKLASGSGVDFQAVIDSLRSASPNIWRRWPIKERDRFLRHLRVHWDASRHRIPTKTHQTLKGCIADGSLCLIAGRLLNAVERNHQLEAVIRDRGTHRIQVLKIDRIVNCTGSTGPQFVYDKLTMDLVESGLARIDPLRIGVDTGYDGALLSRCGEPNHSIFTMGQLRKACSWETTAVREIRQQAAQLACLVSNRLNGEKQLS